MDENGQHKREDSKPYGRWLMGMSIAGGLSGWVVQGMLDGFMLLALPVLILAGALFTLNGDNIIEALVVLLVVSILFFSCFTAAGGIGWGAYVALCISKLGFAFAKEGMFRNKPFS